jgi:hypothetical protein
MGMSRAEKDSPKRTPAPRSASGALGGDSRGPRSRLVLGIGAACIVVAGAVGVSFLVAKQPGSSRNQRSAADLRQTRSSKAGRPSMDVASARHARVAPAAERDAAAGRSASSPDSATSKSPLAAALRKLAAAQQAGDRDAVDALKQNIERLIEEDPTAAAAAVLAALKSTEDELALAVLTSLLSDPSLTARPDVLASVTDMAQHDDSPARRAAAARALGNLAGEDASRVDLVARLERADPDAGVREAAAVALGTVGDRAPSVAAAAAQSLVAGYANEDDPRVRSMLLYAVRDTRDDAVAGTLLEALGQDSDPSVRLAAAEMLGDVAAAHRSQAVDALATQFGREADANFRTTILDSIVSAGGLGAVPVLERIRAGAGDLQPTVDDYLAGLRSGEDDMDKLLAIRREREAARGITEPVDDRP